ncbi:MAG TPA: serine hydrolase domain-containing protein [Ktedonobacterales bacterium]|nr:serine hydrolase domain-containing protein [Ktedonobacterales bacterium]
MAEQIEIPTKLAEQIRAEMVRWDVPGVAVGVLRDGQRETAGFGVCNLETRQPVAPDTLFQIGSITKVFTTTLVMRLVDAGTLALDTPVITYLPELRLADEEAQRDITLRHLLSHTGGFYGDFFDDFGMGDDALAKCIAGLHTLPQQAAPGELWAYNNAGFYLAGRIVEKVLDMPFERAMREQVFEPLGLKHSFFFAHEAIVYSAAVGHSQVTPGADEHEVARLYPLPRCVAAAGGIISTVDDLLTFAAFHLGDGTWNGTRILAESSLAAMRTPQTEAANFADAYGLGWAIETVDGMQIIEHGGSTNGFNARLRIVPEKSFAIALLTNSSRGSALYDAVSKWALERYCGLRETERQQIELPDETLQRFAGFYRRPDGEITLSVEDGGLRREMVSTDLLNHKEERYPPDILKPLSETEFIVVTEGENKDSRVDFILAGDGQPRYLRLGGRLAARVADTSTTGGER